MKTIRLGGKYAVGEHEFAIVDDEDYERLAQWGWKAKPNGNKTHVYAIRTQKVDGITRDIRMHREVLGYSGTLDVDHRNRNTLDNRRENLRAVTRSVNARNTEQFTHRFTCTGCGKDHTSIGPAATLRRVFCSGACANRHRNPPQEPKPRLRYACVCTWCGNGFEAGSSWSKFCTQKCKKAEKWARQRASGTLPPSAHGHLSNEH